MKKILALILTAVFAFSLTACFVGNNNANIPNKIESLPENTQTEKTESGTNEKNPNSNQESAEDIKPFEVSIVDYSPYSALLKAYTLDYNVVHTGSTDYETVGMTLNPSTKSPDESVKDASGFCYADLIDLDNNGILELILVSYDAQEYGDWEKYYEEQEIRISELEHPNVVKIYTISPDYGLTFVGSLPLDIISQTPKNPSIPTTIHYGIDYSVSGNKTYILLSETTMEDGSQYSYYGLADGSHFGVEAFLEIEYGDPADDIEGGEYYSYYADGEKYSEEEFFEILNSYGESDPVYITNINDKYIEKLESINKATFDFLEDYPVKNFESYSGAYNDGQFYFKEYVLYDYFPANAVIGQYYKALTMRDYDMLSQLIGNERTGILKKAHLGEISTYVPGYIIFNMQQAIIEDIENVDIANFIVEVDTDNVDTIVMKCIVNEVLDPHTTRLGLQVAGDMYETYFVLSATDPIDGQWTIEEIFDDKFYW